MPTSQYYARLAQPRRAKLSGSRHRSVGFGRNIMKGYVYILEDMNNRYYIGSTNNIVRRECQHVHKHTYSTSRMKEPKMIFNQEFDSLEIARKIELKLKKLKRKDYISKIIKDGFIKIK